MTEKNTDALSKKSVNKSYSTAQGADLLNELRQAEMKSSLTAHMEKAIQDNAQQQKLGGLALWRAFPKQIRYIVGNEACERFSFYGMRSILVVFMTQYLLMTKEEATSIYHLFVSACYLMPLVGAYISDRYWGKYKTIMLVSAIYCLGHGALALWENKMGLFIGLTLIAIGSGGIKPCVSSFVGDQFTSKNKHLVSYVFDLFYFSINFGSFFSTLWIPVLLRDYGPSVAFGIPGILMLVATVVFWLGRHLYTNVPPTREKKDGFVAIVVTAIKNRKAVAAGQDWLNAARIRFDQNAIDGVRAAINVFKVFIFVSIFWALFDQHGSSWILQAKEMNLEFMGYKFEPSQIAALNPIMVMVLIPMFSFGLYPAIEKLGFAMTPLRRMSVGMVVAATSFATVAIYQQFLDGGTQLNVAWHFIPYLLITAAEVMVSITGLEFAYTQAPRALKSTMMSFWLLTVFFGNMLTAYVAKINVFQGAAFFWFFAAIMLAFAGAFIAAASRYKPVDFFEG
jgi:POT family proton-dependent oligopeptide transporter